MSEIIRFGLDLVKTVFQPNGQTLPAKRYFARS
jgi:hypothetical protein